MELFHNYKKNINRSVAAAGLSNLLFDKIYSFVAIKIFRFLFDSKDELSERNVCVKVESVFSNRLHARLLKLLEKVLLALTNNGPCSLSRPQWHKGLVESWTTCLKFCFLKWFKPSPSCVIRLTPLELGQLQIEVGAGLMKRR